MRGVRIEKGQTTTVIPFRLTKRLAKRVKAEAVRQGVSVSELVRATVTEAFSDDEH